MLREGSYIIIKHIVLAGIFIAQKTEMRQAVDFAKTYADLLGDRDMRPTQYIIVRCRFCSSAGCAACYYSGREWKPIPIQEQVSGNIWIGLAWSVGLMACLAAIGAMLYLYL